MTNKKNGKNVIRVDGMFYKEDIVSIEEWHEEWKVCPIQRDHDERAKKQKHKEKFSELQSVHLEVEHSD